jgi:uncharacterized membrane protein YtjA (UPF0391 family)
VLSVFFPIGAPIATAAFIFTWFPRRLSSASCAVDGYSKHVGGIDVIPDGDGQQGAKQWPSTSRTQARRGSARDWFCRRDDMLRWAPGFLVAAVIAILMGLLETLVAATGLEKILLLLFLALFLSPLWLTSFFGNREQKGERSLQ